MKTFLKIVILLLIIGSTFPDYSQEKDIKMEVFEEGAKVLPLTVVDKNGQAVTDLKKREIVLLVKNRNFRDFSLIYPSSHCRDLPVFSNAPQNSCYEIVFPYKSELEKITQIQVGTYRKGVRLRTPETLKISAPLSKTAGQKEIKALENKVISIRIIDPYKQEHWPQANTVKEQPIKTRIEDTSKSILLKSIVPETDSKTSVLKKLKNCQLQLRDSLSINYSELALRYLKLNRVKEALRLYDTLLDRGEIEPALEKSIRLLILEIRRIDEASEKLMNKITEFLKKEKSDIKKTWIKIDTERKKNNIEKSLSYLQEILDYNREQIDLVKEVLNQLPVILGIHRYPVFRSKTVQAMQYREKLDLFRSAQQQLESQLLVQAGRIEKILNPMEQIISTHAEQMELSQQYLRNIEDMSNKEHTQRVIDFVIYNSSQFTSDYHTPFFKKKLEMLGATKELISQPSFFDVITHSQSIQKNRQGFWEGVFYEEITMIYIPEGEFTMGLPWESGGAEDESPEHKVYLDSYWISKYEITFNQYDGFCRERDKDLMSDYGRGRKKRPVVGISWSDSLEFCRWLSQKTGVYFTLPTEAQWEKAARGTNTWKYPWGNDEPDGDHANFADVKFLKKYLELNPPLNEKERQQKTGWIDPSINDKYAFTAPVGSFPKGASPYGVMDMSGNVWEWVLDWYDNDYYQRSPVRNPQKTSTGKYRVSRGGSWDCHPWLLRITGRAGGIPSKGNDSLGFRVAVIPHGMGDL